jgi:hypothetical protein
MRFGSDERRLKAAFTTGLSVRINPRDEPVWNRQKSANPASSRWNLDQV